MFASVLRAHAKGEERPENGRTTRLNRYAIQIWPENIHVEHVHLCSQYVSICVAAASTASSTIVPRHVMRIHKNEGGERGREREGENKNCHRNRVWAIVWCCVWCVCVCIRSLSKYQSNERTEQTKRCNLYYENLLWCHIKYIGCCSIVYYVCTRISTTYTYTTTAINE